MTRLPNDYELKVATNGGNYFKITEEAQEFRILTSPIIGYEYFAETSEGKMKPVRQKEAFTQQPTNSKDGAKPKEFWAFFVWNHGLKKIQLMEITQSTIKKAIVDLTNSVDWADPKQYDLSIVKSGKGKETKYTVTPLPKSRFESDEEWNKAIEEAGTYNLEALYENEDPFNTNPF